MSQTHRQPPPAAGFTLVELVVTLAVVAIISAMAAPSFTSFFDKQRVIDAAEDIYSNLQVARTEAIIRNTNVNIYFDTPTGAWRYGITQTAACEPNQADITQSNACYLIVDDGDATEIEDLVLHRYTNADYTDVSMAYGHMPGPITFDPAHGTTNVTNSNARFTFISAGGKQMRIKIGLLGQIRLCSPSGSGHINSYNSSGCTS